MKSANKNLVLIGMRGSGKSAVGQILARQLDRKFFDSDRLIEEKIGEKISDFVTREGWQKFREVEREIVAEISEQKNLVIATGGGVVCDASNVANLKKNGVVIFLRTPVEILARRIENSNRPSLTGRAPADELAEVWRERKNFYESTADEIVDFDFESENKTADFDKKVGLILAAID